MQNSNSKATTFTLFAHLGLYNSNYHNRKIRPHSHCISRWWIWILL